MRVWRMSGAQKFADAADGGRRTLPMSCFLLPHLEGKRGIRMGTSHSETIGAPIKIPNRGDRPGR
jgi:hypothetical protein